MPAAESPYSPSETTHLVTGADLNHHRTLYAGRCVEWAVQSAYIGAESCFAEPQALVFMSIRNFSMRSAVQVGEMLRYEAAVDYVGESTIGIQVRITTVQPKDAPRLVGRGRFLFCTVDTAGHSQPHGLPELNPAAAPRWLEAEPVANTSSAS